LRCSVTGKKPERFSFLARGNDIVKGLRRLQTCTIEQVLAVVEDVDALPHRQRQDLAIWIRIASGWDLGREKIREVEISAGVDIRLQRNQERLSLL
jgi:hypothetical protein